MPGRHLEHGGGDHVPLKGPMAERDPRDGDGGSAPLNYLLMLIGMLMRGRHDRGACFRFEIFKKGNL